MTVDSSSIKSVAIAFKESTPALAHFEDQYQLQHILTLWGICIGKNFGISN